ncbi:MAG: stearoyl-CoA desaturase (delta-9 desaturase) [Pseudohongiellaceae bacterium]|jgi:stearoyl-CoA desaturase (delta-9 desaturase)
MQSESPKAPIRWLVLAVLGLPMLVVVTIVPWYGINYSYDLYEWGWFLALLTFCEMSITAGYHRLWSHKAYKAHPVLKFIFALGGACALQNDCITWASDHRRHHLYVDDNEKDPYSAGKGFWYSHFEWMIRDYQSTREDTSNVQDLIADPILVWQRKYYLPLLLIMNFGLPVLLGLINGDIWGSLLLAGFLRLVVSQHFTYLINSAAHIWGSRAYDPSQSARDNWFISLFTFGEGYHNYHHTFAWDYRNGIKWYHWDPTKWLIKTCSWIGLTSKLRQCSAYRQELTRLQVQYTKALEKCEKVIDSPSWQEKLELEYSQLVETLNHWAELKQQWYHAKSEQLSTDWQEKFHELEAESLRQRYRLLKIELEGKRKSWRALLNTFTTLPAQSTQTA